MASERFLPGVWKRFWNYFKVIGKPATGSTNRLVYQGEDFNGNNYFETVDKFGRLLRFVEPKNEKQIDQFPSIPEIKIPPEWLRWLRKNRDDPPTEEELIRNAAIAYLKKQRAAELEAEERKNWPELDAKLKQLEAESDYHPVSLYPLYRDLMTTPGQLYMNDRGFYVPDLQEQQNLQLEQQKQQQKLAAPSEDLVNQEKSKEEPSKL